MPLLDDETVLQECQKVAILLFAENKKKPRRRKPSCRSPTHITGLQIETDVYLQHLLRTEDLLRFGRSVSQEIDGIGRRADTSDVCSVSKPITGSSW